MTRFSLAGFALADIKDSELVAQEGGVMAYGRAPWIVALGLTIAAAGACTRDAAQDTSTTDVQAKTDRTAELQREREQDIAQLTERVAEVERKYQQQTIDRPRGTAGATVGLREETQEDVKNIRHAVDDLKTTTADNWWERHEQAMSRTADDIEADVRRLSGARELPKARKETTTAPGADVASSAPFTSRRDRFVKELRARIESWETGLKKVSGRGARETEVDDVRARVSKLDEDLDRLDNAGADDWWDMTKARVSDYIDRVEKSVARLDDNPANTAPKATTAPKDDTRR